MKRIDPNPRAGFTLVELMLSIAVAGILFVALGAMVGITSQAIPDQKGSTFSSMRGGRMADRIATELESAVRVFERGPNMIAFTVADRDGDGHPERIRYSWSGVAGAPVTRQYNDNPPVTVIDNVYLFTLTPQNKTSSQGYLGVGAEDAAESLLIDATASPGGSFIVSTTASCGQYLSPTLPPAATGWRPTRFKVQAVKNLNPGKCTVELRTANANMTPTSTIIEQYILSTSGLSTPTFVDFPLTTTTVQAPDAGLCVVMAYSNGNGPKISLNNSAGELTCNPTQNPVVWSYKTTNSLLFQLYGKLTQPGATQYVNSRYFTSMGIALQTGSPNNPTVRTTSVLLNHPEYLTNFHELSFNILPTAVDVNADGAFDWLVRGGGTIPSGSVSGGTWNTTTTTLDTVAGSDYPNVTVIDLRFRSIASGASPAIALNALRKGAICAPLAVALQLQGDGTQTLIVAGKTSDATDTVLLNKPGLSNGVCDLRLIVDPVKVSVGVILNTVPIGTYPLPRFASSDASRTLSLLPGGGGQFQYVRVREIDTNP